VCGVGQLILRAQFDRERRDHDQCEQHGCDAGDHLCHIRSVTRAASRSRVAILLFAGGVLISGFTILRGIDPFDEGLTLQAARRVAEGQLPYRDFLWAYGPLHPYLLAGLFKLFGTSLLWWRIIRVLVDAGVGVLVYALVRREAPRRVALVSWLIASCAMAQPTGANPFAPALLCTLGALLFATRRTDRMGLIASGVLCALAGAWRIDFGLYAVAACGVAAAVAALPDRRTAAREFGFVVAAFAALTALVYLPTVVADGPADAWRDLIGRSLSQGRYWHLPFPIAFHEHFRFWGPGAFAHDAKDLLDFYVPLLLVISLAAAIAVIALRRLQRDQLIVGLTVLSLTYLAYLLSRTDEFHSTPLIVTLSALLPLLALRVPARLAGVLALLLVLLLAYGAANRLSAFFGPPTLATIHVPVADGVKAPPGDARAIEQMVAYVDRRVPRRAPIYAITRRADLVRVNDPLIYVLTQRDNPTDQDFGLQTSASAQRQIVASLNRSEPAAIVRWTSPDSVVREPNDRGKPTGVHILDHWVAAHYTRGARYGDYVVLVPR
jgi:hypothetical protein